MYTAPGRVTEASLAIDARLLELLCCPLCRKPVAELADGTGLRCAACRRVYPIVDGIPVMLVEDARLEGPA